MGNLARGYRAKSGSDVNEMSNDGKFGLNAHTLLIIKLPDSWVLRILSRSLLLAMVIMALPSLVSIMRASSSNALYEHDSNSDITTTNGFKILPILFRDLVDEGLIKKGHKGLVLGAGIQEMDDDFEFLRDAGIDLVTGEKKIVAQHVFDFVFVLSFRGIVQIDRTLKDGCLVISQLGNDPSNELQFLSNYRIVYLRRIENTVVAMRKVGVSSNVATYFPAKRVSSGDTKEEEKKAALKGLEDAYLEPPRRAALAKRSSFTSRKIKFLPDLLKDSLEDYSRRVFISDDSSALDWFYKNYPMRNQEFEVYDVEIGSNYNYNGVLPQETGVSTWLRMNVRQEDYVVMKTEAQVVEEMLKEKTICLVDELFLECKNQWQHGKKKNRSKRAYWQCLALYGKVRDEGIAVHQWWN